MPGRLKPAGQAAAPVEPNVADAVIPRRKPAAKKKPPVVEERPGVSYIRNMRGIQCRMTLEDGKGRRIELAPRGQRGDIERVNDTEKDDPIYMANKDLIFQEITPTAARKIIANQQQNAREEEHPIFTQLVNERGQKYTQRHATVEQSMAQKGIVVADIQETGGGRFTDKNHEVRVRAAGPEITHVPGSQGDSATDLLSSLPGDLDPTEYHEFLQWRQYKQMLAAQDAENEAAEAEE